MRRRARLTSVVAVLVAGALGIISSTQTWLELTLQDGSSDVLAVAGADAVPVLAPLSLAALALGAALSIVGTVLRYAFGVLTVLIGVGLLVVTGRVVFTHPVDAVASSVTDATGIAGTAAVAELAGPITTTAWPWVVLAGWLLLLLAGLYTLVTARTWAASGRRYRTSAARSAASEGPLDAIDSWDGLSRGDDPTTPEPPR